jgi:integrase
MNFVEPIRDPKKIAQIKNLLKGQKRYRALLLFVVGTNTALRVSDLLTLRVGQFWDEEGNIRRKCIIHEEKRGKRNDVVMNENICEALELYQAAYPSVLKNSTHYVFFSSRTGGFDKPLAYAPPA